MNKKKYLTIASVAILVFVGWYIYYNTSLTFGDLIHRDGPIGKYFKCAKAGERARLYDSDVNLPARCCRGLKWEIPSLGRYSTGDIGTCIK